MFGRSRIVLTMAASAVAMPAASQAPAPTTTAFDGKYVGTATIGRGRATTTCWAINSMDMTITGGQVVIHENRPNGDEPTLRGSVNTAGEVLALRQSDYRRVHFGTILGAVHDGVFLKASFDAGIVIMASKCTRYPSQQYYSTVGTEPYLERLSGNVIKEHRCFPQALTPPAPLTITNGVVRSPANSGGRERQLVKWMHR